MTVRSSLPYLAAGFLLGVLGVVVALVGRDLAAGYEATARGRP